ncbi:MAG: DEAD/DEAH box helicase [Clostridia bacterium]|nr:DEAD/DEAH box helicase [Clostridia bacterium]
MNLPQKSYNLQQLREQLITRLDESNDSTETAKKIADNLFSLDLTVYSKNFSFDSLIYNSFAQSQLDENIAMHPEQLQIINKITEHDAIIISAPTSFGKTFSVFEYIAKFKPQNIVLIVPTLALVDEYMKKIIKKYRVTFEKYKVHTQLDLEGEYDFNSNNIFILTHDRVLQDEVYKIIAVIDLLVIDEVYKLETDPTNDRVLVLNMAYYFLSQKAKKYILLAPFIQSIEEIEKLEKQPYFYRTDYSPVVNKLEEIELVNARDRYSQCNRLVEKIEDSGKTLIYFPTVSGIYRYIKDFIAEKPVLTDFDDEVKAFIDWAKEEIHEEWSVVKALERGYAVHNGQIPLGIRLFQLNLYENNESFNKLLCTSTLLEGVNTSAKNIIITCPSRQSERENNFTAFDFFNLVGRTGRLNQHYIGNAYYIKAPEDPIFLKSDAIKSVKFEISDSSKDIDIQKGNTEGHEDYLEFLSSLEISHEDYIKNIGSHFRFETIKTLYRNYNKHRLELVSELKKLSQDNTIGRFLLIKILYAICEDREDNFHPALINSLINRNRLTIHKIVDDIVKASNTANVDFVISSVIKLKTSYIEHQFYAKLQIVQYFMKLGKMNQAYLEVLNDRILGAIEHLYFSSSKQKKMLLDIGIYERDVDDIIKIIGDDFDDIFEMKKRLIEHSRSLNIGYISRYIIKNL